MDNRLFLPISPNTIQLVLDQSIIDTDGDDVRISIPDSERFQSLSLHELAALYIVNELPKLNATPNPRLEIALHGIINEGIAHARQSETPFMEEISSRFSGLAIRKGMELAKEREIYLLPEQDVERADFLDDQGRWDYDFKADYKHPEIKEKATIILPGGQQQEMFSDQHRIFRQIEKGMSDEHFQIQGYAGTGKTHMLSAISEVLVSRNKASNGNVLALANSTTQLKAMGNVLHPSIVTMTFGQLASYLIPTDVNNPNITRLKQYVREHTPNPVAAVAKELGLRQIREYSPNRVSSMLFQIVARFCWSGHDKIIKPLIPKWVGSLGEEDTEYVLAHAELLWELATNPPSNFPFQLPIRDYHAIKYASLKGYSVPRYFSHMIVDESHDISDAMMQIIERSSQGFTGLGDTFQATNGVVAQRQSPAIERQIVASVRTPGKMGAIVNFSLELHSLPAQDEFVANRHRPSNIEYYDRPDVPEMPTAIWVDDMWELFEWAERMSALNVEFRVLGSAEALDQFVTGCIQLFREGKPSRTFGLSQYSNWDAVLMNNQRNRAVKAINTLLEKGYKVENWKRTKALITRSGGYVVGLFENSRNHEFDRVMMAPAIVNRIYDVRATRDSYHPDAKAIRGALASRLYLGITRSRHTLIVPQSLEEFMHFQ